MDPLQPNYIEIDLDALRHNVQTVRGLIGDSVKLYAVCKGDGYGAGAVVAARAALAAGADALAVGGTDDALALRDAGITAPILLYASTLPQAAARLAELDITVTVHDLESLEAFARVDAGVDAFIKVDTGYGRLGLLPPEWETALTRIKQAGNVRLRGIYTHIAAPEDHKRTRQQVERFQRACAMAEDVGFQNIERMLASSRVIIDDPGLAYNAVNPGRALYGMLEGAWRDRLPIKPVFKRVVTHIIQVKSLPTDRPERDGEPGANPLRVAVIPFGWAHGYPPLTGSRHVLVNGKRARVLMRSMEHSVIDLSEAPDAQVGDPVVVLGEQQGQVIDASAIVQSSSGTLLETLAEFGKHLPRRYLGLEAGDEA